MKISDAQLDKLLGAESPQSMKSQLAARHLAPSPPQAAKLLQRLQALGQSDTPVKLGIVHTYTSELLDPWLALAAALNRLTLDIYHAPYGVTVQEATPTSGLARHQPDVTLMLLRPEDIDPTFSQPIACISAADRAALGERFTRSLLGQVQRFRDVVGGQIIVTLLPGLADAGLGLYDAMAEQSERHWWSDLKRAIAGDLREQVSGATLLDMDQLVSRVGADSFFDTRLWYSSTFPFSGQGAYALADAVTSIAASLVLTRAKVIVLDADNTLWGGVIGEDGMHGIALSQEYPGRAYVDFQRRMLALQQRGFILALCSKNNPEDLNEVLDTHPHQVLKAEHFAAMRVNWTPKPDNLRSLAEELNLGLDSFIFVDDSDYECSAVRHALPEVEVVQVPAKPVELPSLLDTLPRLQITSLTAEDLAKTAMYNAERERKSQMEQLTTAGGSIDDYLRSLDMKMTVGLDAGEHLPRLSQLTQKTNQFNLTTRRYSESDIADKIAADDTDVYHFSLVDTFGDSGIVGLAIVDRQGAEAILDTFLMSCRVIGRQAEQAFLATIRARLRNQGIQTLTAEYIPTRKNVLVETFLPDNGFTATTGGHYVSDLSSAPDSADFPIDIQGPA